MGKSPEGRMPECMDPAPCRDESSLTLHPQHHPQPLHTVRSCRERTALQLTWRALDLCVAGSGSPVLTVGEVPGMRCYHQCDNRLTEAAGQLSPFHGWRNGYREVVCLAQAHTADQDSSSGNLFPFLSSVLPLLQKQCQEPSQNQGAAGRC